MDTYYITAIYKARPSKIQDMPFGEWFCNAHKLHCPELLYETVVDTCKRIILKYKYNELDQLPLSVYNAKVKND